jgi:caffeic acid 3-O-methyltransferase
VTILRNCFNALPKSGGKVIAVESVLPDLLLQSELDAGSPGAKERTLHEFRQIAKAAGFASVSVVVAIDFLSVLEFNKA